MNVRLQVLSAGHATLRTVLDLPGGRELENIRVQNWLVKNDGIILLPNSLFLITQQNLCNLKQNIYTLIHKHPTTKTKYHNYFLSKS